MAATGQWKVYDAQGKYQAACKEIEAAAALVAFYGDGATIRHEHSKPQWTEGVDGAAAESYDVVAETVHQKMEATFQAGRAAGKW